MKKKILCTIITGILLIGSTNTAFAGTWKLSNYDHTSWHYIKDNGVEAKDEWIYDKGSWYYIYGNTMAKRMAANSGNDKYYVGADGKMVSGGFIQRNKNDRSFVDKDGKLIGGLFMVDGILYEAERDNKLISNFKTEATMGLYKPNGKKFVIHYFYDNGKVLDLDGQPCAEDSDILRYAQYIPKYDSQGNFLGAIDNGHKPTAIGTY